MNGAFQVVIRVLLTLLPVIGVLSFQEEAQAQNGFFIFQRGYWVSSNLPAEMNDFTDGEGMFAAEAHQGDPNRGVSISFVGDDSANIGSWSFDFAAAGNARLQIGRYTGATRYPFQSASVPGLSVTGHGRGCNVLSGEFEVLDGEYGLDNSIVRFAARFTQLCENTEPALIGAISFNSSVDVNPDDGNPGDDEGDDDPNEEDPDLDEPEMCDVVYISKGSDEFSFTIDSEGIVTDEDFEEAGEEIFDTGKVTVGGTKYSAAFKEDERILFQASKAGIKGKSFVSSVRPFTVKSGAAKGMYYIDEESGLVHLGKFSRKGKKGKLTFKAVGEYELAECDSGDDEEEEFPDEEEEEF